MKAHVHAWTCVHVYTCLCAHVCIHKYASIAKELQITRCKPYDLGSNPGSSISWVCAPVKVT